MYLVYLSYDVWIRQLINDTLSMFYNIGIIKLCIKMVVFRTRKTKNSFQLDHTRNFKKTISRSPTNLLSMEAQV